MDRRKTSSEPSSDRLLSPDILLPELTFHCLLQRSQPVNRSDMTYKDSIGSHRLRRQRTLVWEHICNIHETISMPTWRAWSSWCSTEQANTRLKVRWHISWRRLLRTLQSTNTVIQQAITYHIRGRIWRWSTPFVHVTNWMLNASRRIFRTHGTSRHVILYPLSSHWTTVFASHIGALTARVWCLHVQHWPSLRAGIVTLASALRVVFTIKLRSIRS